MGQKENIAKQRTRLYKEKSRNKMVQACKNKEKTTFCLFLLVFTSLYCLVLDFSLYNLVRCFAIKGKNIKKTKTESEVSSFFLLPDPT